MTCRTCTHYYLERELGTNGACMDLLSSVSLFDEPRQCERYAAEPVIIAQDKAQENRAPVRLPERWISEQTEMQLSRKYREFHK